MNVPAKQQTPLRGKRKVGLPLSERVKRFANTGSCDECWLWTGAMTKGYGMLRINRTSMYAHRASWIAFRGNIPEGMHVLHKCDTPLCVNPDHLEIGSHAKNMKDAGLRYRHKVKLTHEDVDRILADQRSQYAIALQYNVSQSLVSKIKRGERRCR